MVHLGRARMLLVTADDVYIHTCVPTRVSRLVSRSFTFIIRRFTAGSHYRMQIRGVPKAEGQSRGFDKKQPHAAPSYTPPPRQERDTYTYVRAFDTLARI